MVRDLLVAGFAKTQEQILKQVPDNGEEALARAGWLLVLMAFLRLRSG